MTVVGDLGGAVAPLGGTQQRGVDAAARLRDTLGQDGRPVLHAAGAVAARARA